MKDAVKVVLKTALFTFLSIVVLCLATYFIMLFFFPVQLGDFFYSLGCESVASSLYHRVYEKTDDVGYIYKCLNIEIKQNIERKEVVKKVIANDGKETIKTTKKSNKIGRNDPCPCGSGRKYKMCCGK